jgi:hypothetical protein
MVNTLSHRRLRSPEARGSVNESVMLRRYRGPLAVRRVGYGACEIVELRFDLTASHFLSTEYDRSSLKSVTCDTTCCRGDPVIEKMSVSIGLARD